jgi:hypothetical protein
LSSGATTLPLGEHRQLPLVDAEVHAHRVGGAQPEPREEARHRQAHGLAPGERGEAVEQVVHRRALGAGHVERAPGEVVALARHGERLARRRRPTPAGTPARRRRAPGRRGACAPCAAAAR